MDYLSFKKNIMKTLLDLIKKYPQQNIKKSKSLNESIIINNEIEIRLGSFIDDKFISKTELDVFNNINQKLRDIRNVKFTDEISLDIITNIDIDKNHRITIRGIDNIKEYCKNSIIDKNVEIIEKSKLEKIGRAHV